MTQAVVTQADIENQTVVSASNGCKMFVDNSDSLKFGSHKYEDAIVDLVKKYLKPGMNVLDIGANIGFFSLLFARLTGPEGKVFVIEAAPHNVELLKHNCRINEFKNIKVFNMAASDFNGTIDLHLSEENNGMHRIYQSVLTSGKTVNVDCRTVDSVLEDSCEEIDIVKMDIEGAEVSAIKGMERLLKSRRLKYLFLEFSPIAIFESGNDPLNMVKPLVNNFKIYRIGDKDRKLDAFRPRLVAVDSSRIFSDISKLKLTIDLVLQKIASGTMKKDKESTEAFIKSDMKRKKIKTKVLENWFCCRI